MIRTIEINGKAYRCELKRSRRRSIAARIRRDGVLEVRAPLLFRESDMISFVKQHWRWLEKHYDKAQGADSQRKNFVTGEMHYYLGKEYELKVVEGNKNSVRIEDNILIVNCKSTDDVERLLDKWYRERAKVVFSELLGPIVGSFRKYNVAPAKVSIRDMRSRWGSCSRRGNISLNLQLIKLPENCIRQVMVHEMCHLIYFDHQAGFYSLMEEMMPDWKEWKKQLRFL